MTIIYTVVVVGAVPHQAAEVEVAVPPQPPMWQTGKSAVALSETNSAAPIPAFPRRPFVARMSDLTAIVRPAMSAPGMEPAKWPLPITPPAPIYRAPSVSHRLTVAARPMLPPTNATAPARSLPLRIPAAPLPTSLLPCPRLWNTAKSVSSPPKSTMPLPAV